MGLDMYLSKKTYIGNNYKEKKDQTKIAVKGIKQERVVEIVERVGYWRKASAIHNWFVLNIQDGEDDCGEYYLSEEKMEELLNLVTEVRAKSKLVKGKIQTGSRWENGKETPIMEDGKYIKNPEIAEKLLPAIKGFFFGSTDYDSYYIADLKLTEKILTQALKEGGEYYYGSSW